MDVVLIPKHVIKMIYQDQLGKSSCLFLYVFYLVGSIFSSDDFFLIQGDLLNFASSVFHSQEL